AQSVEKIRTDVRVINRELLNNSYTIDQLRQTFENNPAIKLLIKEKDYINGTMSEVQVIPSFDTVDINEALSSLYNSKGIDEHLGSYVKALYTNKFKIPKGKQSININLDNAVLSKSDVVILDIIANNVDRPIYFSAWSNDNFLSLEDYLTLEGFAYRLNFEKNNSQTEIIEQKAGTIDSEKMYDNVMHGFSFKHFDKNIYFNETERNIISYYVQNLSSLAYKLLQEGENEKALSVLNKSITAIPFEIHSYPLFLVDMALMYSILEEKEMASNLMKHSIKEFKRYMNKYFVASMRMQAQQ
ncbi:MAG: hypothetical protein Q4Q06_03655, partial [Bacteroidota bacterium]|nr:hypothetical protein [Bacteroidota bacterium]